LYYPKIKAYRPVTVALHQLTNALHAACTAWIITITHIHFCSDRHTIVQALINSDCWVAVPPNKCLTSDENSVSPPLINYRSTSCLETGKVFDSRGSWIFTSSSNFFF
jgi:hypothetical protein